MRRIFAALLIAGSTASLSPALMIAMRPPAQRAISAEAVVIGKVTAIEKDPIDATPFPGAPNKLAFKIAVVQVETSLAGANNVTHIKIGFIPPAPQAVDQPVKPGLVRPPIRRGPIATELKVGQEFVFFLVKHPDANFYVMPNMSPPLDVKAEETKKDIESLKKVLAVVGDPGKALEADKANDRAFAAAVMASKYRSYPDAGGEVDQVPIPAAESKLILKGLAEGNWTKLDGAPNAMQVFYSLGLTEKDGWVAPKAAQPQPGQPPANYNEFTQKAFVKWLDGPGKDYSIKKIVPKKK